MRILSLVCLPAKILRKRKERKRRKRIEKLISSLASIYMEVNHIERQGAMKLAEGLIMNLPKILKK
jgi:hypothetical protein